MCYCGRDRELRDSLRSEGGRRHGRPREARRREVLDRHRAAVDEKLEIVASQVQDPAVFPVGHDDVDVDDLDVDTFAKALPCRPAGWWLRLRERYRGAQGKREAD